jgi:AcrR family transcriptional regulator
MATPESIAEARVPLSRERVLQAAMSLADAEGIESLTMRKLARVLGVEAMSLYNHVANKDEILAGIIDLVASEIDLPSDQADWKTAIRQSAISTRDVFLRHRWASGLWMSRQSGGPAQLRRGDWMLGTLREADLSQDLIYHAYHILEAYILGATVQRLNLPYEGKEELADMAATFLSEFPADEYPDLLEHVRQHLEPRYGEGGFELGLDLILDGLDRARTAGG